jgi:hypothetical protein
MFWLEWVIPDGFVFCVEWVIPDDEPLYVAPPVGVEVPEFSVVP